MKTPSLEFWSERFTWQRWLRLLALGALALAALMLGDEGGAAELLTRISDVRSLGREMAAAALPVQVRGVVTWRSGKDTFTIQDESAGIWIGLDWARKRGVWQGDEQVLEGIHEGMEVEIEGLSDRGDYAPMILPVVVRILGSRPQPQPRPLEPARFFSGADDCQRVEVKGVVQGFYPLGDMVTLVMDANPGRFAAQVAKQVVPDPAALVDAEIRLQGVAATRFNARGEATGSRVIASLPGDLQVERPPPAPGAVPRVALDHLLTFRTEPIGPHRVRTEGTVIFSLMGKFLYLQDGTSVVRVETNSEAFLKPGDRVEAAGFLGMSRPIGMLTDADVSKTGVAMIPEPVAIAPEEILAINRVATKAGQKALPHDYDGHLIRCRARLLTVQSPSYGSVISTLTLERNNSLEQGTVIFRALFHGLNARQLDALRPGSDLEVTGLVQLEYPSIDSPLQASRTIPVSLDLILRSPADVTVLHKPSWWTAGHFTAVLAAVMLALGGALVWNLQLKRQVRKKSRLLTQEKNARRDAALEFRTTMRERNRLAANLHDTLPQTMSAIGLQLDACEYSLRRQGIDSLPPLEMVRTMVGFAVKELRGAVWEMRSFSLRGRSFPDALQEVVERAGGGHSAKIAVRTDGPLEGMPEFVSGNLLLIVQEALRNARQHGNPANISVEIRADAVGGLIHLVIVDDGTGFTPGSQNGPEQGHYGIVGMRERAERLGGSLRVESSPDHGTRIVAEVSRQAGDDDLVNEKNLS